MKKLLFVLSVCVAAWLYAGGGIYFTRHEEGSVSRLNTLELFESENFWFDGVLLLPKGLIANKRNEDCEDCMLRSKPSDVTVVSVRTVSRA
jgi:hypothetical protein